MENSHSIERSGLFLVSKNVDVDEISSRVKLLIQIQVSNQEKFLKFSVSDQEILKKISSTISFSASEESGYINFFDENT